MIYYPFPASSKPESAFLRYLKLSTFTESVCPHYRTSIIQVKKVRRLAADVQLEQTYNDQRPLIRSDGFSGKNPATSGSNSTQIFGTRLT